MSTKTLKIIPAVIVRSCYKCQWFRNYSDYSDEYKDKCLHPQFNRSLELDTPSEVHKDCPLDDYKEDKE